MSYRYLVEIRNSLVVSISQGGYSESDQLPENHLILVTELSPSELFDCVVSLDGTIEYLGPRPAYHVIDPVNKVYVLDSAALKTSMRMEAISKLAETDWVTARAYEKGEPVPQNYAVYRQALRDITNQPDPFNITWPVLENAQ
jgi:hypothetical protein